jgi:DNA invertase Pin-like site-specific DNA recombinase
MKVGYARVSTTDQNPQLQLDALLAADCAKIFTDKASGADVTRPELAKALAFCRGGDTFVCWKLDRVARSLFHLLRIVEDLDFRDVAFKSITEAHIDTTTAAGKLMLQFLGGFAEFERSLIRERTLAGMAASRARGYSGGPGRPSRITAEQARDARGKIDIGVKARDICHLYGVSRAALYRAMDRHC